MDRRIIISTQDGSDSIFDPAQNVHFHSIYGALTESKHVFIRNGLALASIGKSELKILEMGFGSGLNAYLSFIYSKENNLKIEYTALENEPLSLDLAIQLNYPMLLKSEEIEPAFEEFHRCGWDSKIILSDHFSLTKLNCDLENFESNEFFDLIYFDAFAPETHSNQWSLDIFQKLFQSTSIGGILVTYCAKGSVKRKLKEVGYKIESPPGPPGKREMTRAIKYN